MDEHPEWVFDTRGASHEPGEPGTRRLVLDDHGQLTVDATRLDLSGAVLAGEGGQVGHLKTPGIRQNSEFRAAVRVLSGVERWSSRSPPR